MTRIYTFIEYCKAHLNVCLFTLLVLVTLYHLLFPEFIQFNGPIRWDGKNYATYAIHFPKVTFEQQLNVYRFQRILPSGIVYYVASILNIPLNEQTVIYYFLALNIVCIFISFGLWVLISRQLQLSNRGKLLSFTGLFVNYALLKMAFYYPLLTDIMAFTLGMGMLYCYLRKNDYSLLLIGVIGAFTFPTILYCVLLLYMFPVPYTDTGQSPTKYNRWNTVLALLTAFGFLLLIFVFYFYRQVPLVNPNTPVVLLISILASLLYVYFATKNIYQVNLYIQAVHTFNNWWRVFIALSLTICIHGILSAASNNESSSLNYKGFLANIITQAITNPFAFLVSHFVYAGPVFLVLLYFMKLFIKLTLKYSLGLHWLILLYILLSIGSETRQFINAWPFLFFFLAKSLESVKLPVGFYLLIFTAALAISKFWYEINVPVFSEQYLQFPEQRYFMSLGPWMSDEMYMLQGSIALLLFAGMYLVYFRKITPSKKLF